MAKQFVTIVDGQFVCESTPTVSGWLIVESVEDLAVGADITDRAIFALQSLSTITSISLVTKGTPIVDDSFADVTITIKDKDGNVIVEKMFDVADPPPDNASVDLGALANEDLEINEHVTFSVAQSETANMPAFNLVFEGYYREG